MYRAFNLHIVVFVVPRKTNSNNSAGSVNVILQNFTFFLCIRTQTILLFLVRLSHTSSRKRINQLINYLIMKKLKERRISHWLSLRCCRPRFFLYSFINLNQEIFAAFINERSNFSFAFVLDWPFRSKSTQLVAQGGWTSKSTQETERQSSPYGEGGKASRKGTE